MAAYDLALEKQAEERKRMWGVYPAIVQSVADPDRQGRVKVRLPWSPDPDDGYEAWARLATFMAGKNRGAWFIPDEGDEVLVAFEAGDPRCPYVVGSLWNGQDNPPETMDEAGENNRKVIASRQGIRIVMDDADGQVSVTIQTPGGQQVVLKDTPASLELTDRNGNTVKMEQAGITLQTSAKLSIQAGTVDILTAMVKVDAGMSQFSGVVKSDAKITNSVVSGSYTPGAGNMW